MEKLLIDKNKIDINLSLNELKEFLDSKVLLYNTVEFIDSDPLQIPHQFNRKEDIEIAAFLTATIAWGNRKSIINNAERMMKLMGYAPYEFVMNHSEKDLKRLDSFVHRTFNGEDFQNFIINLKRVYLIHGGLEHLFQISETNKNLQLSIHNFKKIFFEQNLKSRSTKHVSDPLKNSAAKRINMFLRWMVRSDQMGVDFGIWKTIKPSELSCPLDVHCGFVARKLGLLKRKQNDAKALVELDDMLRQLDPDDPVKYDFALFGLGVFEKF